MTWPQYIAKRLAELGLVIVCAGDGVLIAPGPRPRPAIVRAKK